MRHTKLVGRSCPSHLCVQRLIDIHSIILAVGKSLWTTFPDESSRWIWVDCAPEENCLFLVETTTNITDGLVDSEDRFIQICKEGKEGRIPWKLLVRHSPRCCGENPSPLLTYFGLFHLLCSFYDALESWKGCGVIYVSAMIICYCCDSSSSTTD